MYAYSDLVNHAKYVPNAGCRSKHTCRLRTMCMMVKFLSQTSSNPCHDIGGTYAIIAYAHRIEQEYLAGLIDWFPNMNFIIVSDRKIAVSAKTIITDTGGIDTALARKIGDEYGPYIWYINAGKIVDELTRVAMLQESHATIAAMNPVRAMYPFRHAYVDASTRATTTLRYNGELWLRPWSKPTDTVTMLNYEIGCMMLPCETALDYEQKMFYWNRYIRTGTSPTRPRMYRLCIRADVAIQTKCLERCPRARAALLEETLPFP
jgi:hypothetical protein